MKMFIAYGLLITTLFAAVSYKGYSFFGNPLSAGGGSRGHSSYHK